jgi:hypothetical protein
MSQTWEPWVPKQSKFPRLRTHVRKGSDGRVFVYYYYDRRPDGLPDVNLGKDRADALAKWEELHHKQPRIKGTLEEAFARFELETLPEYDNAETRRGYAKSLKWLRKVFSTATWDATRLTHLVGYLRARKAKTQANREMSLLQIIWNKARLWGMTELPWPAAGMERSKWKNAESAREFEVTDELFAAVYAEAEPMLRDCMDLSTATGMRLTDCRTVLLPADNILRVTASKTNKRAGFDLALSAVLPDLLAKRRAMSDRVSHLMLLTMPDGSPVTPSKLRGAYDRARVRAIEKARQEGRKELAAAIRHMILRDMRKRAADLADSAEDASKLLQHSSQALTEKHYRTRGATLKPVR